MLLVIKSPLGSEQQKETYIYFHPGWVPNFFWHYSFVEFGTLLFLGYSHFGMEHFFNFFIFLLCYKIFCYIFCFLPMLGYKISLMSIIFLIYQKKISLISVIFPLLGLKISVSIPCRHSAILLTGAFFRLPWPEHNFNPEAAILLTCPYHSLFDSKFPFF